MARSSSAVWLNCAKGRVSAEEMIQPEDLAEAVRFLLRTSRNCYVPEIVFTRPGEAVGSP